MKSDMPTTYINRTCKWTEEEDVELKREGGEHFNSIQLKRTKHSHEYKHKQLIC